MKKTAPEPETVGGTVRVSDKTLRSLHGYQMKRTFNVIQSDLIQTLKPFDLRMLTYTALVLIVDNPGLRQSQLAEAMDVERPNLVVILDELERRDLIVRDRLKTDRRAYALKATLSGRRLCEKAVAAVSKHEEHLLRGIGPEDRAVAIEVMRRIEANRR
ncbi:MarR family winged helix-turn-helix transcriptional regulator [Roseibium aggregatum]|uniref:MarR family transcriptional regulator n=1 Tax=Roseibium aggregatum TaxID=187304 RepID=A0A939EIU2_9HYPH|nr:MarR family transcriptional regulator [Roseibium aggregatum]MBN9673804.1 MarR family transcriptional regulator [Roseibium aggregatum]